MAHQTGNCDPRHWRTECLRDIRARVVQAGVELFAAYGVVFDSTPPDEPGIDAPAEVAFWGVAGFGGPLINGFVVLETSEKLLRHCNTTTSPPADWMAELANQFLGRIKNRLMREGMRIHRIPPIVLTGPKAEALCGYDSAPMIELSNRQGRLSIWMKSEPATDDDDGPGPDEDVMAEGEMALF